MNMHYGRFCLIIKLPILKKIKLNFNLKTPNIFNKVVLFIIWKGGNAHTVSFFVTECSMLAGPLYCCSVKITVGASQTVKGAASLWIPKAATPMNLELKNVWFSKEKLAYQRQCHLHLKPVTRNAYIKCHRLAPWCQWNATKLALGKQMHLYTNIRSHLLLDCSRLDTVSQVQGLTCQPYREWLPLGSWECHRVTSR